MTHYELSLSTPSQGYPLKVTRHESPEALGHACRKLSADLDAGALDGFLADCVDRGHADAKRARIVVARVETHPLTGGEQAAFDAVVG